MTSLFVDPVVGKIIDVGFNYLKDHVRWTDMEAEQQKMRDLHTQIQAVNIAASKEPIQNPEFNRWLWQLRDAIDVADDVLDEFEILKYEEQLARNRERTKELHCISFLIEGARKIFERALKFFKRALKRDASLNRLEEAVHKLVNVSAGISDFLSLFKIEKEQQQKQLDELYEKRETGALPTNNFIGRHEEMESIMQWLRNSSIEDQSHITSSNLYKNISLLSIVGHGGIGKTTLSQHVYNNVMSNEFDVKMWVCVSPNFNEKKVIAGMFESLKSSKCDMDTFEGLQRTLKSEVDSKKFLLVLDDIWEGKDAAEKDMNKMKWGKVFSSLAEGSLGSKILLTTRTESVASMIADVLSSKDHKILKLKGMKKDDCLQLLKSVAIATGENPDDHKKLILEQIVKKVLESPLLAKVIGGVLRENMNERYWKTILKSDIRSIEGNQNFFFILKLSYIFLSMPLQRCFSFCSMFPQNHEFDKDDLIRMWIALNFIQPSSNPIETLEDIGERYFDILVKKSFFEKFQYYDDTYYYKMHDLLHELAQFISKQECYRVVGDDELSNYETIRHLSVKTDDLEVLRKIIKCTKLRSLFLSCDLINKKDFVDVLSEIFKASSSIRLLFVMFRCDMPEAIGNLIHLRYLKYERQNRFTRNPISNLERIKLEVPFGQFRSLKSLYLRKMPKVKSIDYIPSLEVLHIEDLDALEDWFDAAATANDNLFPCLTKLCLRNCPNLLMLPSLPPKLQVLKMVNIRWKDISWLDTSNCYEVDIKACRFSHGILSCLKTTKKHTLSICDTSYLLMEPWSSITSVIDLTICKNDNLVSFPNETEEWFLQVSSSLGTLNFKNLKSLQSLPSFLKSLSSLEYLNLSNIPLLKSLPDFSFSLKVLELEELKSLLELPSLLNISSLKKILLKKIPLKSLPDFPFSLEELQLEELKSLPELPSLLNISSLKRIILRRIRLLKSLAVLPPSLKELSIENLGSLECMPTSLSTISTLKILELATIPLLKSLPDLPPSLEILCIENLKSLECMSSSSSTFSSLKILKLASIPLLKSLPDLPPSLQKLSIENLKSLEWLPSSLSTISSLRDLHIWMVPLLQKLPELPSSLKILRINSCHEELKKCYDKISGFDRDMVAHIPYVDIS